MAKLKNKKINLIFEKSEWVGLFVFIHFYVFQFLLSTTFGFEFSHLYRNITNCAVIFVGIFRLMIGAYLEITNAESTKQRLFIIAKIAFAVIILVPINVTVYRFKYTELMYLPFLAYCLYNAKPERVLKAYAICIGTLLAATVLSSLSGAIPNYLHLGNGAKGVLRGSYGIKFPTDFAAYVVFIFLFAWGSGRFKNWWYTAFAFAVAVLMAYVLYTYPRAINSTICSILIGIVVLYDGLNERVLSRHKGTRWITKIVDWLTIGAFPLFAAVVFGLSWLYGKGNGIAVRINQIISNRLYFIWYSYEKYGLHWFGTLTPQKGGGLLANDEYEFIDSSFGVILLRYGTILFVMVTIAWVWSTWRAVRTGHRRIALVMAVIAFHAIMEQRFTEINILLVMPLCCFAVQKVQKEESKQENRNVDHIKKVTGWSVGTLLTGVFLLLVPKILSVARSLIVINEWNGEKTFYILIFWFVCFAFFVLLGYFIYDFAVTIIAKKKLSVRTLVGIAFTAISATVCLIWCNSSISDSMLLHQTQIETDRSAVDLILENANEPVYIGQNEEIYKRSFNGISDHVLSPEEMARTGRGSMLLDHDNDAFQLISTGARYAELSRYTGLFTYDDAVIEALRNNGYRVHGYYSAERDTDFEYLAKLNDLPLTEDGSLQLSGEAHTLKFGSCISQLEGTYSVTFSLQLKNSYTDDPDAEICTLRASAMWGRNIWIEKNIHIADVDENGHIIVTLNYSTWNTEGVEYLVFCRDGMELNVERISWKSTPVNDTWREYTSEGLLLSERFFTAEGEPFAQPEGYYGVEYEYANGGNYWIKCRYLDADGKTLRKTSLGYAQVERQYNNLKQVIEEKYLDINGSLCFSSGNFACYRQFYDSRGNLLKTNYYDTEGKLISNNNGYAVEEYNYDNDGNRILDRFLDENNKLIMLSGGYAEIHRIFDEMHRLKEVSYYDVEGKPCNVYNHYAKFENKYDEEGNYLTYFTDALGVPLKCGSGYFHNYLQSLKGRDITILISVKDEGTYSLTDTILDDLNEIGVRTYLKDKFRYSFYAIVTNDNSIEEISNSDFLTYRGNIGNIQYSVISAGCLLGNTSSIIINDVEYSKNTRGMNFVIVDNKTGEVIDSVAFDTYAFDMWPTR